MTRASIAVLAALAACGGGHPGHPGVDSGLRDAELEPGSDAGTCAPTTCADPPPPTCLDTQTLRDHDSICTGGVCSYPAVDHACTAAPAHADPVCADEACSFSCRLGYVRSGATCIAHAKLVFLSSERYTGNLGSLGGADAKCQSLAVAAGLDGTFKAWLSDSAGSAAERMTHAAIPYMRTDGHVVANSWADLTDGALAAPIDVDEHGAIVAAPAAWTDTNPDGSTANPGLDCNSWLTTNDITPPGLVGDPSSSDASWTGLAAAIACATSAALYCIGQ